ncbi:MAG: hypothetical protein V3R94_07235 [Acidobacteriota bacterium]
MMKAHQMKREQTRQDRFPLLIGTLLWLVMTSCAVPRTGRTGSLPIDSGPRSSRSPAPLMEKMTRAVEGEILRHLEKEQAAVLATLAGVGSIQAHFKQRLVLDALTQPWTGMRALERQGHRLVGQRQTTLIGVMEEGMGRLEGPLRFPQSPQEASLETHLDFVKTVLEQAQSLRALALRHLSREDRRFLFDYPAQLVEDFYIHFPEMDDPTLQRARDDLRFLRLINHQLDYPRLVAAARVLTLLADSDWLMRAAEIFSALPVSSRSHPAVQGDILLLEDTSMGQIIIGGPGSNQYHLVRGIALLIDVGGNDTYSGNIAAAVDIEQGNRVVIDLAGNDTYHASRLGLATGRLGVGLLIDSAGSDQYHLPPGSGGSGFAGLGLLFDLSGNDEYRGSKLTQGAAIGGLGLLWDGSGNDIHSSYGYSQGFGGPLGTGTLMDVKGDDSYQCGDHYPSSYNENDVPSGDPDDPLFQYDAFCMGFGSGTLYRDSQLKKSALAGGLGMIIDQAGNDLYLSANFSQGSGYFFGAGIKLDLEGNDRHTAARYGQGTAAHFGVGLFVDSQGSDQYTSSGVIYNGGSAWDRSVTVFIDGGPQSDSYHSFAPGRADHGSWSLSIDEGGPDRYSSSGGFGSASEDSMVGFFDLGGQDEYVGNSRNVRNNTILLDAKGGLFVDR